MSDYIKPATLTAEQRAEYEAIAKANGWTIQREILDNGPTKVVGGFELVDKTGRVMAKGIKQDDLLGHAHQLAYSPPVYPLPEADFKKILGMTLAAAKLPQTIQSRGYMQSYSRSDAGGVQAVGGKRVGAGRRPNPEVQKLQQRIVDTEKELASKGYKMNTAQRRELTQALAQVEALPDIQQ